MMTRMARRMRARKGGRALRSCSFLYVVSSSGAEGEWFFSFPFVISFVYSTLLLCSTGLEKRRKGCLAIIGNSVLGQEMGM